MVRLLPAAVMTLTLLSVAIFRAVPPIASDEVVVGVKTGDWIKSDYSLTNWPAGTPYPEWQKVEFLSVEGTNATVRVTMHLSDGNEFNSTAPVDVVAGGQVLGFSGLVIPANLTTGDTVYLSGYGNVTITGETVRPYAGANRTVVSASFSQSIAQFTYYWDKQTGVMAESFYAVFTMTVSAKATETNMWEATENGSIHINADGSIDPPTAPILRNGDVYTLTDNITSEADGIVVEMDNIVVDGSGFTVEGTRADDSAGIFLYETDNVTIQDTNINRFICGILVHDSANNRICRNNITNCNQGILLTDPGSDGNSIIGNTLTANRNNGIVLSYSSHSSISGNTVTNNNYCGIELNRLSDYNSIVGNNIANNSQYGVRLESSSNNSINGNTIKNSRFGIVLDYIPETYSSNNTVFHNNLINNTEQVYDYTPDRDNFWDNGCEGNYWSNYNGTDLDNDGIGDTFIPWEEADNYPLMNVCWNPCDINHDLKVDMRDIAISAIAFASAHANPHADVTGPESFVPDGKVDMRDIGLIARNFGERYS